MRNFTVVRRPQFEIDLAKRLRYWNERDPERAEDILYAVEAAALHLGRFPETGHRVEVEPGKWSETVRHYPVGDTGLYIRFKVEKDLQRIVLMRLRHEAQRPLKR